MPGGLTITTLSPEARRFLEEPRFAVVGTVSGDGTPHQAVIWYGLDGETFYLNGAAGRLWCRNLERDGRLSLVIADKYDYVEIRGRVDEIDRDQSRALHDIEALARRYLGDEAEIGRSMERYRTQERISYRLTAERIRERFGEG